MTDRPPFKSSKRGDASSFLAENLLVLGILVLLLGIIFGLYVRTYNVPWLLVAILFAAGALLLGLAWRACRKPDIKGRGPTEAPGTEVDKEEP